MFQYSHLMKLLMIIRFAFAILRFVFYVYYLSPLSFLTFAFCVKLVLVHHLDSS